MKHCNRKFMLQSLTYKPFLNELLKSLIYYNVPLMEQRNKKFMLQSLSDKTFQKWAIAVLRIFLKFILKCFICQTLQHKFSVAMFHYSDNAI